jgi:hypothetical protein
MRAMGRDSMTVESEAKQSLDLSSPVAKGLDTKVGVCSGEAIRARR